MVGTLENKKTTVIIKLSLFYLGDIMSEQAQDFVANNPNNLEDSLDNEQPSEHQLSEVEQLQQTITQLQQQVKSAQEGQARANAESYNAQRRMEAETDKAKKFALQKFAKELLDVADNFERAIANVNDDNLKQGLELTHKTLISTLERNGVTAIDPVGEKFNPEHHEAVGIDPNAPSDTVGVVLQKGYLLHDRLLRPAMVQVGQ